MVKRKAKRVKNVDPLTQEKIENLSKLLDAFKSEAVVYENHLNKMCAEQSRKIEKLYMDRLKSIPENIRNMTIAEVMELQQKQKLRETECPKNENAFRLMHERAKLTSEKRSRTQRKEKKRSISAPASARNLSLARHNPNNMSHLNRTGSELSLMTPVRQRKPSTVVTPKFDPKLPVLVARKPKPGEVLMSLSGSPLQNIMDDLPSDKPGVKVTVSLGQGRVITFGDNAEIESEREFLRSLDEPLKSTIHKVQQKLNEILKS